MTEHDRKRGRGRRETSHRQGHRHGRYGNPVDLEGMIARQLAPERASWQKPAAVIRALGLRRGDLVAEIGAGPGYFTAKLARAVGPRGHVYAVDPEPAMLELLRTRLTAAGARNVSPVLGRADDPTLPVGRFDLVLVVNTYHHFHDGRSFLKRITQALRPSGRLVNIDFEKRETPVGPPLEHRVAREDFVREAARAGLDVAAEHRFLPHQYFLVLRPARALTGRPARQ